MLAEVYYIAPGFKDTAQFLFHDLIGRFPEENSTVDIGKYPEGTPIFFLFIVTDTSYKYEYYKGKKKYTGQNRDSVDILVTDAPGNNAWGKKYALSGRNDLGEVEVSFMGDAFFGTIIFHVSNVHLEAVERNNIAVPRASIRGGNNSFTSPFTIALKVPDEGRIAVKLIDDNYWDTLNPVKNGAALNIYYSLDNSDPRTSPTRQLYTDSISITETTTLKAYAKIEGDTLWYPSPVITERYVFDNTPVRFVQSSQKQPGMPSGNLYIYNLLGRKLAAVGAVQSM